MAIVIESGFAETGEADSFVTNDVIATGAVHWVYSVSGNNANPGNEALPLATLAQAITNATASNGDIIIIKAGHTETISSSVTISKAGLKIFGIGEGSDAPNFGVSAAIDAINVTANDVELNNLYFIQGTTISNTSRVNVDARNVVLKNCTFLSGQYDQNTVTLTANAIDCKIDSCTFTVSNDGPDYGVIVESASAVGLNITNTTFNGGTYNWDIAAVYSNVAHLNYRYEQITLTGDAPIQHANSGAKGVMSQIIAAEGSSVTV